MDLVHILQLEKSEVNPHSGVTESSNVFEKARDMRLQRQQAALYENPH